MSANTRKGHILERQVANHLRVKLDDTRIDIRPKNGTNDRGDVGGIRTVRGSDVVIEVKNRARMELAEWVDEAEVERGNAAAGGGVVVHKRKGKGAAGDQYVTMTLDTFAWLLEGGPVDVDPTYPDTHKEVAA